MKETDYELTPEVVDHMETYSDKFEEWNNKEPYEPSFLFASGTFFERIQMYIGDDWMANEILGVMLGMCGIFAAVILILAI